ncbi:3-dehydroquinate synthase-like [Hibiscus syriacus]|uniref:3-dehydroquinate synthase-like n=1 Tax=Hibiscus syriacus TaxID=106335 RepID=A0A6A2XIF5_HIBSY|nr:3-dehydroquinate synthase-like [Hibiscus syriacus]
MAKICFLLLSLFMIVASAIINGSEAKEKVGVYELKKGDLSVKFTNWGATIVSLILPDKYGGPVGFSDVVWKVKEYKKYGYAPSIVFAYHSYDGDEGFPGAVKASVAYTFHPGNTLTVEMKAKPLNKATTVNLAQHTRQPTHSHWRNHHRKRISYDFLKPRTVGSQINKLANGYDINYAMDGVPGKLKKSGRVMELFSDQPGVQFYTANGLKDEKGKGGYVYQPHAALCLETQAFPDPVNHPNFP